MAPGWTSYRYRLGYTALDVGKLLLGDQVNVIATEVGEGWYAGKLGFRGGSRLKSLQPSANLKSIPRLAVSPCEVMKTGRAARVRFYRAKFTMVRSITWAKIRRTPVENHQRRLQRLCACQTTRPAALVQISRAPRASCPHNRRNNDLSGIQVN